MGLLFSSRTAGYRCFRNYWSRMMYSKDICCVGVFIVLAIRILSFFKKTCLSIYLAVAGLCCCMWASLVAVCRPLTAVASHAAEHGPSGTGASEIAACGLSDCGPRVLEHRLCRHSWPLGEVLCGMGDLLGSGIKPVSPALALWILSHWASWEASLFISY